MNEELSVPYPIGPETDLQKPKGGTLRWVLSTLLAFGLGALLVAFTLYVPTRQRLDSANASLEQADANASLERANTRAALEQANADASLERANASTALEQANVTISGQNDRIAKFQMENEALQRNLDSATLHMNLSQALSGVRGASLAVDADDYAGARLSLIQASEALDTLSSLLGTDKKDVLGAMQISAAQALSDVRSNLMSARPELDQLTKNLVQLEDNLFPNP